MPKLYNMRRPHEVPKDAVYIGRPSKWSNPFQIGIDGTRREVVDKYAVMIMQDVELFAAAREELAGKDLVCWCTPALCHGNILLEIANK